MRIRALRYHFAWIALTLLLASGCDRGGHDEAAADSLLVNDVTQLNPTRVREIVRTRRVADLQEAVRRANREGLEVSIAGKRHSQGGHQFVEGGLLVDMMDFDDVVAVDPQRRTVTVEAGATWAEVQEALHPYGLSVAVMQSSNIFTVGGSVSVNAHGRDPRFGPIIDTVRSFRLLGPDGEIRDVSRESDPALFGLALGGFGLFGIILDVELDVVENVLYERQVIDLDYRDYPAYFRERVQGHDEIGLQSARLSIAPGAGFLKDMYTREYRAVAGDADAPLVGERNVARDRFFFGLSRRWDWGKKLRWFLQRTIADQAGQIKMISRNNAMRPPIAFLTYRSDRDTDILQEYFVPVDSFVTFVDGMRAIMRADDINLLHLTVRYVPESDAAFLSYAPADMFALVLYMNIPLSDAGLSHAGEWTRRLVDLALARGGTYYLAYQGFPTAAQIRRAYPALDAFFVEKRAHDPDCRFVNRFFEQYAGDACTSRSASEPGFR